MNSSNNSDVSASPVRTLFAIGALAILGFIAYSFWKPATQELPGVVSKVEEENEQLREQLNKLIAKQAELDAEKLMELENQQVQRSKLIELEAQGKSVAAKLEQWSQEVSTWVSTQSALTSDDRGRRIAGNETALAQYHGLLQSPLPEPHLLDAAQSKLEGLLLPIQEALKSDNPFYQPSEATVSQISEIAAEAEVGTQAYRKANQRLAGILQLVESSSALSEATLESAVTELERRWAAEQNQYVADQIAKVREEESLKLVELRIKQERAVGEANRKAEQERTERELARLDAERKAAESAQQVKLAELKMKADREKLEQEFEADLAEIKRYLAPFLQEAYSQPGKYQAMVRTSDKKPMSFQAMQATGALDDSIQGLRALHLSATHMTDRTNGVFDKAFNQYSNFQEQWIPPAKRAQALLIKYGDLLVEKGMLSP